MLKTEVNAYYANDRPLSLFFPAVVAYNSQFTWEAQLESKKTPGEKRNKSLCSSACIRRKYIPAATTVSKDEIKTLNKPSHFSL